MAAPLIEIYVQMHILRLHQRERRDEHKKCWLLPLWLELIRILHNVT